MFWSAMPVRSCLKSCLLLLCQRSQSAFRSALKHSTLSWHFSTSTGIYGETEKTTATGELRVLMIQDYRLQGSGWCGSFGWEGCIRDEMAEDFYQYSLLNPENLSLWSLYRVRTKKILALLWRDYSPLISIFQFNSLLVCKIITESNTEKWTLVNYRHYRKWQQWTQQF